MKKNALVVFLALSLFWASGVYAAAPAATPAGYTPLVKIPGVPDGEVDIAKYLIGIYSFLLSIVGIVAVVMLIIGGMKYIMAAGSGGAVSGAKQTITDAILGLILALLSYVIVVAINPDVLYLKQLGSVFSKDAITSIVGGTIKKNPDGTFTFTSNEGYVRIMNPETAAQVASGEFKFEANAEEKLVAMKKYLSCVAPGSPGGVHDPSYVGKCKCVTGSEINLPTGSTDCNIACEAANECGYKFISVKLNARHGYTQADGTIEDDAPAGTAATDSDTADSSDAATVAVLPEYDLTASTQVHSDELWEIHGTNNPLWGDFNIVYATTETTQSAQGSDIVTTVPPKRYVETGTEIYPCAILISNKAEYGDAQHFVYWVPLGTTLGGSQNLFSDIKKGYRGGCQSGYYGIKRGTCDQAWTDRVLLAKYSDDIVDKCQFCSLADVGSVGKAYRFANTLTCRSGYWQ